MTVSAILQDRTYQTLKDHVLDHTGLSYYLGKDEDFAARLSRRMNALGITSCAAYLTRLGQDLLGHGAEKPSELNALVGELTIGETYFFRQREHFDLLRTTIIPDLLERNRASRQLRIWSAGCAIGAEPYSIAMVLWPEFAAQLTDWDVCLLGTDINVDFLAQARRAEFSEWHLRDLPEAQRDCCFLKNGNRWNLNGEVRKRVTFRHHNLTDNFAHPAGDGLPFDLILCRNVIIYFGTERIRSIAQQFFHLLKPGGWLLQGHAEYSTDMFSQFELINTAGAAVYRRPPAGAATAQIVPWQPWIPGSDGTPSRLVIKPDAPRPNPPKPTFVADRLEDARRLADSGKTEEAAAICDRLLAADSLNAAAWFTLGLIHEHSGVIDQAAAQLKRAIYVDRSFALAHYHLGIVLQDSGDAAGARKAFANTLDLLASLSSEELVAHGDGIRVQELRDLAVMHNELAPEGQARL